MTAAVQPDLFGDYAAAQDEHAAILAACAAYRARFTRADFTAAYDASGGTKEGDTVTGWVCPGCGGIAWSEFTLSLNHGYDVGVPAHWAGRWTGDAWGTWCQRTINRAYRDEHGLQNEPALTSADLDDVGVIRIQRCAS